MVDSNYLDLHESGGAEEVHRGLLRPDRQGFFETAGKTPGWCEYADFPSPGFLELTKTQDAKLLPEFSYVPNIVTQQLFLL